MRKGLIYTMAVFTILTACNNDPELPEENVTAEKMTQAASDSIEHEATDNNDGIVIIVEGDNQTRMTHSGDNSFFSTGDEMGVYAWDGTQYISSNVKITRQSDGSWTPATRIPFSTSYSYYAYYPYRATTYTPGTSGDVDNRFANFISDASNYFWTYDQSTKTNFEKSNLMIAQGTWYGSGNIVSFHMRHKRGLVAFTAAQYSLWTDPTYTWTVPMSSRLFIGNIPYLEDDGYCYFLVKPNTATTVGGTSFSLDKGKKSTNTLTMTYTMQPGDVYYSPDGALSRPSETLADRTPLGMVVKVNYHLGNDDAICEGKAHGLIQALEVCGNERWVPMVDNTNTKDDEPDLTNYGQNTYQNDLSGQSNTDILRTKYAWMTDVWSVRVFAAYKAWLYQPAPLPYNATSGWFLPSSGQWVAAIRSFAQDGYSITGSQWNQDGIFTSGASESTCEAYINAMIAAGGTWPENNSYGNYTMFWTSTENTSANAICVMFMKKQDSLNNIGAVAFGSDYNFYFTKHELMYVLPFLAF